jgi:parvulin-like peptidyl-prolyl isomerase
MVGVALLLLAAACRDPEGQSGEAVAALVDGEPIYVAEVERYLAANLVTGETEADLPAETADEVKSRLFDALLDERIFYLEAQRRGITVSDAELAAYLDMGAAASSRDEKERSLLETEARRRLMAQKLQEQVIDGLPPPGDDEIEAFAVEHRERLSPERLLELRALQLRSPEEAKRVHREIARKRMTFNEAALAYEPTPGQALPLRMSWNTVPQDLRQQLEKLEPGQVSQPIELHGVIYLFQVGEWISDPAEQDIELMHRAAQELESRNRRDALDALLGELRRRSEPRVRAENLPFRYTPEAGDGSP